MARDFEYYINLDERGEFFADVRTLEGETVFEIHGFDIFEDGFMGNIYDVNGLKSYLVTLDILHPDDKLVIAN